MKTRADFLKTKLISLSPGLLKKKKKRTQEKKVKEITTDITEIQTIMRIL